MRRRRRRRIGGEKRGGEIRVRHRVWSLRV
jgi:hypothetical protein